MLSQLPPPFNLDLWVETIRSGCFAGFEPSYELEYSLFSDHNVWHPWEGSSQEWDWVGALSGKFQLELVQPFQGHIQQGHQWRFFSDGLFWLSFLCDVMNFQKGLGSEWMSPMMLLMYWFQAVFRAELTSRWTFLHWVLSLALPFFLNLACSLFFRLMSWHRFGVS